jgi:hypothetical protein
MGDLYELRKASIAVVQGLTSKDYINVVTFNTGAIVASCWQNNLVRATEENKQVVITYITALVTADGLTNIEAGLELAFSLLTASVPLNQTSFCQQIVILLTDGVTSATQFNINNYMHARIFVYMLSSYTDTSPLQRLACENDGVLVPVPNPSNAYIAMGTYYEILSPGRNPASPIWVGPYLNQYTGSGTALTVVYPCFDYTQFPPTLIGVVGVDLLLSDIEAIVNNFMAFPSYSFITNNVGEALVHPSLPSGDTYKTQPLGFDITDLEGLPRNAPFLRIRSQMVAGVIGDATLNKTVHLPRGYMYYEGYVSWNVSVRYLFEPMVADYFVVVAWATYIVPVHDTSFPVPLPRSGVTHVLPDAYLAAQSYRSSFSVSARGFCNPVVFLGTEQDSVFSAKVIASVDQPSNQTCPTELLSVEV